MLYPTFDPAPLGGSMLIAIIAILHVVLAHGAVGGGIFTAVALRHARRTNDLVLLRFLRQNTRFLILVGFGIGAITGVGIWFAIGLVSPRATSAMIHAFVWMWAIEWVFFFVEIASGYIMHYGWDRLTPRQHQIVAWVYAGSAWLSLFVITGILSFMLSPNDQAVPGQFRLWPAFFNPTFWPSVWLRTISSLALAGIFTCAAVNISGWRWRAIPAAEETAGAANSPLYTREERTHIINYGARFLVPLGLMIPLALWWFAGVPDAARRMVFGGAVAMNLFFMFGMAASVLVAAYAYIGLIRLKRYVNLETALLLAVMAFIATGAMEFVREGIRKPYVIPGYLWSNSIADRPDERTALNRDGILAHARWLTGPMGASGLDGHSAEARGELVFSAECAACHTTGGPNDVAPLIATWRRQTILQTLDELHERKPFMPPFFGTASEKEWLADYLWQVAKADRPGQR